MPIKVTTVDGLPRSQYTQRPDQAAKRKAYRELHAEDHLEYYRTYRERHPERQMWRSARDRANKKSIEFNIQYEDIKIPKICPVLNIPIVVRAGRGIQGGKFDSPSLDRIDNSKGYIKGNVQVISHLANSMKSIADKDQLLSFAAWVIKEYGN